MSYESAASDSGSGSGVTPEQVLQLEAPCKGFLCPLSVNEYGIDFLEFRIRDMDSNRVVFEVQKEPDAAPQEFPPDFDFDQLRRIDYDFPADFLRFKAVGTMLRFKVGDQPLANFRMVEMHYFRDELIEAFDFTFPFCMPNSVNEYEAIYEVPELPDEILDDMINSPYETTSDSFYFVGDKLIMHNKASYRYVRE